VANDPVKNLDVATFPVDAKVIAGLPLIALEFKVGLVAPAVAVLLFPDLSYQFRTDVPLRFIDEAVVSVASNHSVQLGIIVGINPGGAVSI
jgi:hypothetical protein